jgi:hypothetical protein
MLVENRCCHAAQTARVLFVVDGIAFPMRSLQVIKEQVPVNYGVLCDTHKMRPQHGMSFDGRESREDSLANGAAMRWDPLRWGVRGFSWCHTIQEAHTAPIQGTKIHGHTAPCAELAGNGFGCINDMTRGGKVRTHKEGRRSDRPNPDLGVKSHKTALLHCREQAQAGCWRELLLLGQLTELHRSRRMRQSLEQTQGARDGAYSSSIMLVLGTSRHLSPRTPPVDLHKLSSIAKLMMEPTRF